MCVSGSIIGVSLAATNGTHMGKFGSKVSKVEVRGQPEYSPVRPSISANWFGQPMLLATDTTGNIASSRFPGRRGEEPPG